MLGIASVVVNLLTTILPIVNTLVPSGVQNIITLLEQIIPVAVKEGTALIQPIQNIIASLQGSGVVTADQVAALQAQSAALDAALDAAAASDNLV